MTWFDIPPDDPEDRERSNAGFERGTTCEVAPPFRHDSVRRTSRTTSIEESVRNADRGIYVLFVRNDDSRRLNIPFDYRLGERCAITPSYDDLHEPG
jgi:hypothetical protein